ncbi:AAA family ATPase [Aliidiomarina haloalkalitolerans]|uniref:AAA family ATPase n=1 Tax=Aliidiomarina haloalkalitolerans TaxID=859059 RepID=A0A432VPD6_9GAMM|nr:AAA family ATPase [Aliidiomarina haloalkalitolerans]RUO17993.1 hypothetical protein CWE06_12280 [Aliidiomarina haloalkalitolerans]
MSKINLIPITNIMNQHFATNWLVASYFEKESVCMVFGEPASYKSFLVMDIAFCIATGNDWCGNAVSKGHVLYIAGEGHRGIQRRFTALEGKYGCKVSDIVISDKPASLMDSTAVNDILDAIDAAGVEPELIVIDTLHRNFGGGDENSSRDFGVFMRHIDEIKSITKATIIVVHHTGHADKGHSRGSSAIRASMDAEYQLKIKGNGVELRCLKMKEFEQPQNMSFSLRKVDVNVPTGLETSAYIEQVTDSKLANKSTNTQIVLQALSDAIAAKGSAIPINQTNQRPELTQKRWVDVGEWRSQSYSALSSSIQNPPSQQQAFNRARNQLIKDGKIEEINGFVVML